MALDDLPIPAPMISDQLLAEQVVGAENVVQDDLDRIVHTVWQGAERPAADTGRRYSAEYRTS